MSSRSAAKKIAHKATKPAAKAHKPAPKLVKVAPAKKPAPAAKAATLPKKAAAHVKAAPLVKAASPVKAAAPVKSASPVRSASPMTSRPPSSGSRPPPPAARPLAPPPPRKPTPSPMIGASAPLRAEQPKQSLARSFYWSELRIGDDLPPLSKPTIDRVQIARYASSSSDFNRLHLDEPFAHAVGFPGVFAPGMLAMGFIGQLLTSWLRRGHVRRLSARFVKLLWPGDELTCRGRIGDLRKEQGACYADVELWAENQKGELVLRGQATCELYESPQAAGGDGAGFLFGGGTAGRPGVPQRSPLAPEPRPSKAPAGPAKKK